MSLKDLDTKQVQYFVIGGLVAVGLIVGVVFGIRFSLSSIAKVRQERNEVVDKIESANRVLSRQDRIRQEFSESMDAIKAHLLSVPPVQNYESRVTEIIYAEAQVAKLEIDAIAVQTRKGVAPNRDDLKFESYSLRITARGGYDTLKRFLVLIEMNHPLARVESVDISSGTDPEIHDLQLIVQWPLNLSAVSDGWNEIVVSQQDLDRSISSKGEE